ncbi:tRNA (adenosine(37)-N6)-threonylcarbamoyltransferase complex dimerization subunit type 1 TsaB [Novosphingobium guangzhouense]|uniref:tRNA N6-adenosine(37)-N6-threonylcarbamoyltransferase complex dimerization subunit TsaB n=1 Tax=Novosphingobium guangzhouense TaxID=1850347 RepID=A0A2K2FVW3_9SPHN|nr:tRNA (adenosine(37)-N6)-threonylcarbamoyltransferase complex dimerization subunit type 1 TsaB [Novosphingobium guangzhouense]PNU02926.1 tRNA N6-adenosine(37)-N6-threonylcarbamoyltransferase complex dimerization subunit TsaB [Novosphingobium guangzhouense]
MTTSTPSTSTLVIDSATDACSVALFSGDTLVAGEYRLLGRGHAEALVPMIAALPGKGRANRIAVALGPGSFTGVRVGLAAARALALAWGAQIAGYPTLALIAAMARDSEGAQPLSVVTTGGHGEWFVESFAADGASTSALASLRPDAASLAVTNDLVAGSQAQALVTARGFGRALPLLPDARAFALLPASALLTETHPLYGRGPDAKLPAGAA